LRSPFADAPDDDSRRSGEALRLTARALAEVQQVLSVLDGEGRKLRASAIENPSMGGRAAMHEVRGEMGDDLIRARASILAAKAGAG
jgi:hypothetical protein